MEINQNIFECAKTRRFLYKTLRFCPKTEKCYSRAWNNHFRVMLRWICLLYPLFQIWQGIFLTLWIGFVGQVKLKNFVTPCIRLLTKWIWQQINVHVECWVDGIYAVMNRATNTYEPKPYMLLRFSNILPIGMSNKNACQRVKESTIAYTLCMPKHIKRNEMENLRAR